MSYNKYLYKLLEFENGGREQRSKEMLLKIAGFPKIKTIDTFDYKSSSVDKTLINELLTFRFIDEFKNILLFGPSGVGKNTSSKCNRICCNTKKNKSKVYFCK